VRITVTRAREDACELADRLAELGHEVVVAPLVQIEPIGPNEVDVSGYDWVIVTSRNGARQLARRMRGSPARVAAIGAGTAQELPRPPDLVPAVSTQEGLLAELARPAGRVLFAGAEGARRLLVDELDADFVPLYRTKELRADDFPQVDLVVLASASAARAYAALDASAPAVCIGPRTAAEAARLGIDVRSEAETHDVDGVVEAVRRIVPAP
jgi:uroporphyrinogen III methyltransferase / synthase